MKFVADEAVAKQKEIDIQCQHKITEMVALMEKHKVNTTYFYTYKNQEKGHVGWSWRLLYLLHWFSFSNTRAIIYIIYIKRYF